MEKEIIMEVVEGGGRRSRKRSGARRRRTRVEGSEEETVITKESGEKKEVVPPTISEKPVVHAKPVAKVVLAPPKKKVAKVMLVPKGKVVRPAMAKKTFKIKKVRMVIDNTAKTQKRRKDVMTAIDAMTEDQVRAAAVTARLSRRETVSKVPIGLLRQMMKDYQTMRGALL
jgi:hypothetical protein